MDHIESKCGITKFVKYSYNTEHTNYKKKQRGFQWNTISYLTRKKCNQKNNYSDKNKKFFR